MQKDLTIAVIGLGLIGGSILKKLKNTKYKLIGVSRSPETIHKVIQQGLVSEGSTDIEIIRDVDIVFVCTPINKTVQTLITVRNTVKPKTIITDAASLKGFILDFVNTSDTAVNFIGGHPMAGTENKGIDASFEKLFEGAKWVLTPSIWTTERDIILLEEVIKELGANPVIADAHEHDKAVALISHMPLLLSQVLFSLVKNYPDKNIGKLAMRLAASGFRDMTRLAATNPELAGDMLSENKPYVIESLKELVAGASEMQNLLSGNEKVFYENYLENAECRAKLYSPEGKNIYPD